MKKKIAVFGVFLLAASFGLPVTGSGNYSPGNTAVEGNFTGTFIADGSPRPPLPPALAFDGSPRPPLPPRSATFDGSPRPPLPPGFVVDGSPRPPLPPAAFDGSPRPPLPPSGLSA
jgi:hypothetical protein